MKNGQSLFSLSTVAFLLLLLASCQEKDVAPESILTALVNGKTYETQSRELSLRVTDLEVNRKAMLQVTLSAESSDGHTLKLFFNQEKEGAYNIEQGNGGASYQLYRQQTIPATKGEIKVTSYGKDKVTGSFHFDGKDLIVRAGNFTIYLEN